MVRAYSEVLLDLAEHRRLHSDCVGSARGDRAHLRRTRRSESLQDVAASPDVEHTSTSGNATDSEGDDAASARSGHHFWGTASSVFRR